MHALLKSALVALASTAAAVAQVPPASVQSTSFNSSFALSPEQIKSANLSDAQVSSIENILNFDRSQLANGGPQEDDFYTLSPLGNENGSVLPGRVLKVQTFTNTTPFSIPPNTALSRILYTTTDLNGTVIPASAFILWPFIARHTQGKSKEASVVLWAHGTSTVFASGAPSTHRSLWYAHEAPFTLALEGYAVVAPDYAGLGIGTSWDGTPVPHQYLASPASAHDALYALEASFKAFPDLFRREFVTMGHSQGGGVAWAVAEVLENEKSHFPVLSEAYRGAISGSPTTDVFSGLSQFVLPFVSSGIARVFPSFELEDWLTPLGVARTELLKEVEGGIGVAQQLFLSGENVVRNDYNETWYTDAYGKLANAGRKNFKGPMLVLQGTNDSYVSYNVTVKTFRATCDLHPHNDLELLVVPGVGHVPVLDATRQVWLQWIADRFNRKPLARRGCLEKTQESLLPIERYLSAGNSFLQWAGASEYSYQVPLGP